MNSLAVSTDYTSVRLCANHIGKLLELYIGEIKPRMPTSFFYYVLPEEWHEFYPGVIPPPPVHG